LFLDAVAEMARPSRSALLLADQAGHHYRVGAYRGLTPHVAKALTLPADSGLPLWLTVEGRLMQIDEAQARPGDTAAREIVREMAVLQAVVAIPLISHGELVAILTLGQRITGARIAAGKPRSCSISARTSPRRSATSACITCSSTRRNSTSGSSPACRTA
jgi:GAF domain-containing protein